MPGRARVRQAPPPLPDPFPPGPAQPTSVEPFVFDLGEALYFYGTAVAVVAYRRPRAVAGRQAGGTW